MAEDAALRTAGLLEGKRMVALFNWVADFLWEIRNRIGGVRCGNGGKLETKLPSKGSLQ